MFGGKAAWYPGLIGVWAAGFYWSAWLFVLIGWAGWFWGLRVPVWFMDIVKPLSFERRDVRAAVFSVLGIGRPFVVGTSLVFILKATKRGGGEIGPYEALFFLGMGARHA